MEQITLVVGPARSGKTHWATEWVAENPDHRTVIEFAGDEREVKHALERYDEVAVCTYPTTPVSEAMRRRVVRTVTMSHGTPLDDERGRPEVPEGESA